MTKHRSPGAQRTLALLLALICTYTDALAAPTYKSVSKGQADDVVDMVRAVQSENRRIDVLSFANNSEWVLIAGRQAYYSRPAYFDKLKAYEGTSLKDKIDEYLGKGLKIDAVAIGKNNWIVIAGKWRFYSDKAVFDRTGIRQQIERLYDEGKAIQSISFTAEDRWVVVAEGIGYGSKLPKTMAEVLENAASHERRKIKGAWFRPGRKEWLVLADHTYWSSWQIEDRIDFGFNQFRRKMWSVDLVALAPSNGITAISNEEIVISVDDIAGQVEFGLVKSSSTHQTIWDSMKVNATPGVVIAVIANNKIQSVRGYGKRKGNKGLVAHDTIFSVASMSKAVASFGILRAVQDGVIAVDDTPVDVAKLHPDSTVSEWLKRLEDLDVETSSGNVDDRPIAYARDIHLLDLLHHTAGLNRHGIGLWPLTWITTPYDYDRWVKQGKVGMPPLTRTLDLTASDIIFGTKKFRADGLLRPIQGPPRTKWKYSGGGFTLAEVMTSLIAGQSFPSLMGQTVLQPIGMDNSTFGSLNESRQESRLAYGHTGKGAPIAYRESPGKAAGGLYSTGEDYARFVLTLLNSGRPSANANQYILKSTLVDQMLTPAVRDGGSMNSCQNANQCSASKQEACIQKRCQVPILGSGRDYSGAGVVLRRRDWSGSPDKFWHGGDQYGYHSFFLASLDKKSAIVILTNGSSRYIFEPKTTKNANPSDKPDKPDKSDCKPLATWRADNKWDRLGFGEQEELLETKPVNICGYDIKRRGATVLIKEVREAFGETSAW